MITIKGKYADAKIFTTNVDEATQLQIKSMIDHEMTEGTQVRIMPDTHLGKGSTIGTTIKLSDNFADWKVSPNVVGIDLGCGVMMYRLDDINIDLEKLDTVVNEVIPAGFNVHKSAQNKDFTEKIINGLTFNIGENTADRIHKSLGTLGGGNHFIELGKDEEGNYWLSVHSGSRNLGVQVATHHQDIAIDRLEKSRVNIKEVVDKLKLEGRHKEIESTISKMRNEAIPLTHKEKELSTLKHEDLKNYMKDIVLAQSYASKSRGTMLDLIVEHMGFTVVDKFDSVHNFIEYDGTNNGVIRKGATSAKEGERLVIPLNMRDGSLICVGKGNEDWNNSAPHGAGRMMSRSQARRELSVDEFKKQMGDVYSSSVGESTIDEAPDAYKPAQSIIEHIKPTADILHVVKPVYNFKAH